MSVEEVTATESVAESFVADNTNPQGTATPPLELRVKRLIEGARTHRDVVDVALAAVVANKAETEKQYATITAQVIEVVALFQADEEAAEKLFEGAKVKCRSDTANPLHYRTAKYLEGNGRGGGPSSKVATIAAALSARTSEDAMAEIEALGGFSRAYAHFRLKTSAPVSDSEKFVGAELIIHLKDGSTGIIPVSPEELVRLGSKRKVVWRAPNNTPAPEAAGLDGEGA
ncbi:hypothetical protein [Novispirillum itersonii]|uniref:Uncharacterized protein n=1 Tax=Novispirillum itersonii TaxID=189 RepID=A0A7X0DN13_NOVIT|nr:hypothetical protein [Novispirillum itersonii]MBB6210859.1 hypothetical protein [Novispirillum itersonii]